MQIRTVTCFADPGFPVSGEVVQAAGRATAGVKRALEAAGYAVQTTRLALPPFARVVGGDPARVVSLARDLESACRAAGIDYATIGPACSGDARALFQAIPDAIAATGSVFASTFVADPQRGADLAAIEWTADLIARCAHVEEGGFGNLRFAALFNVPPGIPFLPAAYHGGSAPAIALGVEAASVAVDAVTAAASLDEARARLIGAIELQARRILAVAEPNAAGMPVTGIDFSLAPFPEAARSIGLALERLSGARVGGASTLAAVAFLADALDRARFVRVGYCGVFLPVFEDAILAARAAEGRLTVNDLLLYSSVCGTGLDTVPLAGDISPAGLAAILLDVAALALRLDKPLSARLMPIPGKRAGDEIRFDFPYFAPTRVLGVDVAREGGLLGGDNVLQLRPRQPG